MLRVWSALRFATRSLACCCLPTVSIGKQIYRQTSCTGAALAVCTCPHACTLPRKHIPAALSRKHPTPLRVSPAPPRRRRSPLVACPCAHLSALQFFLSSTQGCAAVPSQDTAAFAAGALVLYVSTSHTVSPAVNPNSTLVSSTQTTMPLHLRSHLL